MSEFTEFTLGQETPPALDTEGTELKPKKGDQYRVSFISLHGLKEGTPRFEEDGKPLKPKDDSTHFNVGRSRGREVPRQRATLRFNPRYPHEP